MTATIGGRDAYPTERVCQAKGCGRRLLAIMHGRLVVAIVCAVCDHFDLGEHRRRA